MLIACAVVAVWFASFGFDAGLDVRRSMLLLVLVAATSLALFRHSKRRVFWAAFAIVMLLCGGLEMSQPLNRYVPDFGWRMTLGTSQHVYPPSQYRLPGNTNAYGIIQPAPDGSSGSIVYPYPFMSSSRARTFWYAMGETIAAAWTFVLAALSGAIAVFLYRRRPPHPIAASPNAQRVIAEELGRDDP